MGLGEFESEDKCQHAERSACIFAEYAQQQHLDENFAEQVTYLFKMHSNKELLNMQDTKPELIILMEADLLDEEGALRVIWYCATKAIQGADSYLEVADFIQMGSDKRQDNPMITPLAKEIWNKKIQFVNDFLTELRFDIDTDISFLDY